MHPKVIIMLGGPASGKGTQAKILAHRLGYQYFGTGDMLRAEVEKKSTVGVNIAALMDRGELVPDELTDPLVVAKLNQLKDVGIVLDGYPRNLDQAETLQDVFPEENFLVLNIIVSDQSLLNRMQTRRVCSQCKKTFTIKDPSVTTCSACGGKLISRPDDKPEVLKSRIQTYNDQTKPIIAYYGAKGLVRDIDGEPPIDAVTREINSVVSPLI